MTEEKKTQEQAAEHVRLAYRHLAWAAEHLREYYNLVKPEDALEADYQDPNQTKMKFE